MVNKVKESGAEVVAAHIGRLLGRGPTRDPPSSSVAPAQVLSSSPSHTSTAAQRPPEGQQLGKSWPVQVVAMVWNIALKLCRMGMGWQHGSQSPNRAEKS